jgi:D-alanyl-D-alanine dipeptidase
MLPRGLRLLIIEGYRPLELQRRYFRQHCDTLRAAHPDWPDDTIHHEASRYIAPPGIAPHVAGAAIDITLATDSGVELPLGTAVNATPQESGGACYTAAPGLPAEAAHNRRVLVTALSAVGLVNYPCEWWHWSYGDRYWAFSIGAPAAIYGPVHGAAVRSDQGQKATWRQA